MRTRDELADEILFRILGTDKNKQLEALAKKAYRLADEMLKLRKPEPIRAAPQKPSVGGAEVLEAAEKLGPNPFVASCRDYFNKRGFLSEKQVACLQKTIANGGKPPERSKDIITHDDIPF